MHTHDLLHPSWPQAPWVFAIDFAGHLIRYVGIAGAGFVLFYVLFRNTAASRKIQQRIARFSDIRREVLYSLSSLVIFSALAVVTFAMHLLGWNKLYIDVHQYGWHYLWFSTAGLILLHDAWFYWTHRAMHWKPLFRVVHRVHHMSHNPTPWAAFAFHPLEAVVEGAVFPLLVIVMPLHPLAAAIWLMYMTLMNVFGHLGYEVLPPGFLRSRLFRWHNTSVHHNMHHSHVHCNYGLYFNIWDGLMGTNHAAYEKEYERVTEGRDEDRGKSTAGWRFSGGVVAASVLGFILYVAASARVTSQVTAQPASPAESQNHATPGGVDRSGVRPVPTVNESPEVARALVP